MAPAYMTTLDEQPVVRATLDLGFGPEFSRIPTSHGMIPTSARAAALFRVREVYMSESTAGFAPYCFCTRVSETALKALLEVGDAGAFKDNHPWFIAQERVLAAQAHGLRVAILFAAGEPLEFSHWAEVTGIEVNRFRQGAESRISFSGLQAISPLWSELDALLLLPSAEQSRRERLEGLRPSRVALDAHTVHPYAICERPAFLLRPAALEAPDGDGVQPG